MSGFNLVSDLKGLNGAIRGKLSSLGGAKSPEMWATGKVLRLQVARTLAAVSGNPTSISLTKRRQARGGTPSAPGEAPHRQTGQLAKSVAMGVVGTGLRIGALRFTALFLEAGVNATAGTRKTALRGRRRQGAGTVKRTLVIAPRPYLERSIEAAKDQMGEEFAGVAAVSLGAK